VGQAAGLLFFQGEADALTASNRALTTIDYASRFSEVIEGFRRDLLAPRLPVVFAQIGRQDAPGSFRTGS
jgi:Carbohydrate esterase, sialic acid-specific acetylesterase